VIEDDEPDGDGTEPLDVRPKRPVQAARVRARCRCSRRS